MTSLYDKAPNAKNHKSGSKTYGTPRKRQSPLAQELGERSDIRLGLREQMRYRHERGGNWGAEVPPVVRVKFRAGYGRVDGACGFKRF